MRCGSQRRRLALPAELERGRADDDRREGAVGLERRQRLRRSCRAPARRRGTRGARRARSARRPTGTARACRPGAGAASAIGSALVARERRTAAVAAALLGAQPPERPAAASARPRRRCRARNASSCVGDPRVERHGRLPVARRAGARTPAPTSWIPQHLEPSRSPSTPRASTSRAGRRVLPERPLEAAIGAPRRARAAPSSRSASAAARVSGDQQPVRRARTRALEQRRPGTVPARVSSSHQPRPSWRAVRTRPTQRRSMSGEPRRRPRQLMVSSGKRSSDLGDVDAGPVVDRRPPFAGVPVEAAARDVAHERHDRAGRTGRRARRSGRSPRRCGARHSRGLGRAPCSSYGSGQRPSRSRSSSSASVGHSAAARRA